MQFQVPQFIETEDKIVGPLTLRQFAFTATAGIISALLFLVLETTLWLPITIVLGMVAIALAFGKLNGRPLSVYASSLYSSIWKPKIYVFKPSTKEGVITQDTSSVIKEKKKFSLPKLSKLSKAQKRKTPKTPPIIPGVAEHEKVVVKEQVKSADKEPLKREELKKEYELPSEEAHKIKLPSENTRKVDPLRATSPEPKLPETPVSSFGGIKNLREWMATSKNAIPKREKPLPRDFGKTKERLKDKYEVVRYITGEREMAKRVDYRKS